MAQKQTNPLSISGFMRQFSLNFPRPFARKNAAESSQSRYPRFEISDFSRADQSELLAREEEICPLIEAEVYLIYGRQQDAETTLAAGFKSGRISAADVARFWATQSAPIEDKSGKKPSSSPAGEFVISDRASPDGGRDHVHGHGHEPARTPGNSRSR